MANDADGGRFWMVVFDAFDLDQDLRAKCPALGERPLNCPSQATVGGQPTALLPALRRRLPGSVRDTPRTWPSYRCPSPCPKRQVPRQRDRSPSLRLLPSVRSPAAPRGALRPERRRRPQDTAPDTP